MRQYHFVVALRDDHSARHRVQSSFQHRPRGNDERTVAPHPFTALLFKARPTAFVERAMLRTHVGHQERLMHGGFAPNHITSRSHVATVQPRLRISLRQRATLDVRVGGEFVGAGTGTLKLRLGQFVGYACWHMMRRVEPHGDPPIGHLLRTGHSHPLQTVAQILARRLKTGL